MVHSEVYLNKYVVSIAPFSTPACPDCSQNIPKTAVFCMFSLFNFSFIFPAGISFLPVCADAHGSKQDCFVCVCHCSGALAQFYAS